MTRTEGDTEYCTQDEGRKKALSFQADVARTGPGHRYYPDKMQPHKKKYNGYKIIGLTANIAHHSSRQGRDKPVLIMGSQVIYRRGGLPACKRLI
ncbi:MAG: hypothetical protein H6Q52_1034 [Deltaproteobacteria bacterium]|nr:hypothetical protein [Deltaproteobacteria bacterium]